MRLRRLAIVFLLLFAAALAAGWVWIDSFDWSERRETVAATLSDVFGRPLRIEGDLRLELDWDLAPEVVAYDVSLGDDDDDLTAHFARIEVQFAIRDLLRGRHRFDEIQLFDGQVAIRSESDEDAPPADGAAAPADGDAGPELDIRIAHGLIENVVIVQQDEEREITATTRLDRVELHSRTRGDDYAIHARGASGPVPFDLRGRLDPVRRLFGSRSPFAFAVSGDVAGAAVEIEGSFERPADLRGIQVNVKASADDLAPLGAPFGRSLPPLGPVSVTAVVSDRDGTLGIEEIDLSMGRKDELELRISGRLDHLVALDELDLRARLNASSLESFDPLFGTDFDPIGPVELDARFAGSDERTVLRALTGRLGDTRFTGSLTAFYVPGARPRIELRLETAEVHLADLGLGPGLDASSERPPGESRIPFERLRGFDGRLDLRAARVTGRAGLELENLSATAVLEGGHLRIEPVHLTYERGAVDAEATLDARTDSPRFALRGRADRVDIGRLLSQFEETPTLAGRLDVAADLESRGDSVDAIARALGGTLRFRLDEGTVSSRLAHRMNPDVWNHVLSSSWRAELTAVRCIIADFQIDEGVAMGETAVLDTDHVTVHAVGSIDVADLTVDAKLTPRAKNPSFLSLVVPVDLSGPIASPHVAVRKVSMATRSVEGALRGAIREGAAPLNRLNPLKGHLPKLGLEAADPCQPAEATG